LSFLPRVNLDILLAGSTACSARRAVLVNQTSNSAIINWNTFNIGVKESVQFNQPSGSSVALNRVTGGLGPSEILGTLTANGRVFLINRAALGRRLPETAPFVLSRSADFKSAAVRTFATDRGTPPRQAPETFSWTRARAG
jgi:filamentous hemagglutinin family protein